MDPQRTIKFFNRAMVYDNLDRLHDYIIDIPLARQYQTYNVEHFGYIDRTGGMKHFFHTIPETPIPSFIHNYNKKFFDVTLSRAQELLDRNKDLYIFWSGGFDSTTILAALFYLGADPDRVVVCMTPDSLYESGNLYDEILRKKFPRHWFITPGQDNIFGLVPRNAISVTGNFGNIISSFRRSQYTDEMQTMRYENVFDADFIDFFQPFISAFPVPIVTVEEFISFRGFNFNWNANEYFLYHAGVSNPEETFFNFFKDMEFQNLLISGNEMCPNRGHMRKFIAHCLGEKSTEYTQKKKTRISYIKELGNNLFVLGDGKIVRNFDELETLQQTPCS
jgi:hypothetical protein